jgi:HEAT repeat protein
VDAVRQSDWFKTFLEPRACSRFWWKRLVAARLLAITGRQEDVTLAKALIADRHPAIKVAGIQVVRRIKDFSLLQTVLDEAMSAQPVVRRYLFDTLVSVRQVLVPVLDERIAKAETIGELRALITLGGELAAVELFDRLLSYVDHEELEIRVAVARALGSYPHPRSEETLTAFLTDAQWQVRTQAASSLGLIRALGARDALRLALSDSDWWVRLRAAVALRQLGLAGTHLLTEAQRGSDRFAQEMARYVLGLTDQAVADYLT